MKERYDCAISALMDELEAVLQWDGKEGDLVSSAPCGRTAFCEAPYPNSVEIASLDAMDRGGGHHVLSLTTAAADRLGLTLTVLASPIETEWRPKPELDALIAFYAAHGFKRDFKRDECWNFASAHMVRRPKKHK